MAELARSWSLCVILSDHCIIVPLLNDQWFFFHKLYHPKLLSFINNWLSNIVRFYFGSFCEWQDLPDLEAYVSFRVTTVLLFHILRYLQQQFHSKLKRIASVKKKKSAEKQTGGLQASTLRPVGSPMWPAFTQWRLNFHAWSPTWPPR